MNQVVVMPYPGRGHINPIMNLCRLLSSRLIQDNGTTIFTVIVTEEWLELIRSDPKPDTVRFATLPNVIPSELNRGSDMTNFFTAVQTKMEAPLDQLLDRMELPVKLIIADVTLKWPVELANRRNIPVAAYMPMSASFFTMWYHVDLLEQHQHVYVDLSERGEEWVDYIPGLSPMKVTDFPKLDQKFYGFLPDFRSVSKRAQSLLLTTVYELEPEALNELKAKLQIPVYTLGPNIPHYQFQPNHSSDKSLYLEWLDSKPPRSVLYVSLGSFLSVSSNQMDEIAAGLKQSGVSFLWVARGETKRLESICGGKGLVVEWSDQLRVLSHSSIGGFWSHCGWNSVKESVFSGVPMLTFPITGDQFLNSKVINEDWINGRKVRKEDGATSFVERDEIAKLVIQFMDSESAERKEMMERVKMLQKVCQDSVAEGGSTTKEIDAFIRENLAS